VTISQRFAFTNRKRTRACSEVRTTGVRRTPTHANSDALGAGARAPCLDRIAPSYARCYQATEAVGRCRALWSTCRNRGVARVLAVLAS